MFIFEKTVSFRSNLCAHTLTHQNIPQKTSSEIKKIVISTLKISLPLIVTMLYFQLLLTVDALITHFLLK